MGKSKKKTTVRGERRVGERSGRASIILGVLILTFMDSQVGVFALPRPTMIVLFASLVIFLGFLSYSGGFKTGGFTGIVLGALAFYFMFVAQHFTLLIDQLRIGDFALGPYLLIVVTAAVLYYVVHQPSVSVTEHGKS